MAIIEQFEFIHVRFYRKQKLKTTWEVCDGENQRYIEIEGEGNFQKAIVKVMNTLGKEGWSLGSYPYNYRVFTMQRKIGGN